MKTPRPVVADARQARVDGELAAGLTDPVPVIATNPGDPVVPLKIGVHHDLQARRRADTSEDELSFDIRRYVHGLSYAMAMSRPGSMRHDLDGNPVEPVSDEHREAARRHVARVRDRPAAKKAASAAPAVPEPSQEPPAEAPAAGNGKPVLRLKGGVSLPPPEIARRMAAIPPRRREGQRP